mmetsp:Transcript_45073/g.97897  ORF Transcript_45073/g.97897 Transcript_45073/m.97897 type:complete len:348 (-) Transcript_45073:173-1216(-)
MKLKRFLLRYENEADGRSAGIALEYEDDDKRLEVKHKVMPPASQVQSCEDISELVANLIEEEGQMLSKRKHEEALMQLLGRLYQIEMPSPASPSQGTGSQKASSTTGEPVLKEGASVVLIGLSGKFQEKNGEVGTLMKIRPDRSKYEVRLADESVIKVKGVEHVIPVAKGVSLAMGTHVAIRGLRNHIELNGCLGRVVECHEETGRFEVRSTESGQLFRVKKDNLIPIDLGKEQAGALSSWNKENREREAPDGILGMPGNNVGGSDMEDVEVGALVQLVGLKSASCYNGQTAEVKTVDRERNRYEIKLGDGQVKTIRAENVRMISNSGASKSSPRASARQKAQVPKR